MQVTFVDSMGSDLNVVNAARVSFAKKSQFEKIDCGHTDCGPECSGFKEELTAKDIKLIDYLADHDHWSPFAHTSIQLHIKAPIFVARQLAKHQTGGVWNEISRRYVDYEPEFYWPEKWRGRPVDKKQGSTGYVDYDDSFAKRTVENYILPIYEEMLKQGVAPEQARMILPQNMYTEWYWTGSLYFFARVCSLRLSKDAQEETQFIARQISNICHNRFPISWTALNVDDA